MTKKDNTKIELYQQIMVIQMCSDALKNIYENIPLEDTYAPVLTVIGERLEKEISKIIPMCIK